MFELRRLRLLHELAQRGTLAAVAEAIAREDTFELEHRVRLAEGGFEGRVVKGVRFQGLADQGDEAGPGVLRRAGVFGAGAVGIGGARLARVGVAGQVRSRLWHERGDWPSMADLAADLHVDERTLRRKLTAEGTSFRRLVDEVRHGRALELLAQGAAVSEVARELGYSETATFTRSFTRWEGVSPSRLRERGL